MNFKVPTLLIYKSSNIYLVELNRLYMRNLPKLTQNLILTPNLYPNLNQMQN